MSKLGFGVVDEMFKDIPKGVIDYEYNKYLDNYTLYFFAGYDSSYIENIDEIDLIVIVKAIRELIGI